MIILIFLLNLLIFCIIIFIFGIIIFFIHFDVCVAFHQVNFIQNLITAIINCFNYQNKLLVLFSNQKVTHNFYPNSSVKLFAFPIWYTSIHEYSIMLN